MFPVRQVLSAIDRAKNQGIDRGRRSSRNDYFDDVVGKAYRLYEERLAAANATDFGGLLLSALRLCRRRHAGRRGDRRSASITCWSTSSRTPTASSTGWCGCCRGAPAASPSSATRTSRSTAGAAPTSATSSTSSATTRARASSSWSRTTARPATSCAPPTPSSRSNSERRPKRLFTEAGEGEPIVLFEGETERDEAEFVAGRIDAGAAAALARATSRSSTGPTRSRACWKTRCARATCRTSVVGGTRFFDRAEIKDLIAYLRAIANPDDGMALQRIINVPARGIGDGHRRAHRRAASTSARFGLGRRWSWWRSDDRRCWAPGRARRSPRSSS